MQGKKTRISRQNSLPYRSGLNLSPESPLTIDVEHHFPHGRSDWLMEPKPHLPAPSQGVVIAFWSWEEGAAHRGVPGETGGHTFMFLLSKHKIHVTKIVTHGIIIFWNFVHQQSVPRSKCKQNTLNASVPLAALLNLDKTFTIFSNTQTTFSFYNKSRTKLTYPSWSSASRKWNLHHSRVCTTALSILAWPSNTIFPIS